MPDATPKFENIPPVDKHWDSPTESAQGSESADLIFISVGHALTTWEWVESIFSILFTELVEGESDAAKRVYGLMTSTAQKQAANHYVICRASHSLLALTKTRTLSAG
jgi:hypothetical protein